MNALEYIHDCGIVHRRNLKPKKVLFRTPAEDAEVMISDFSLSQIMRGKPLTETCGSLAYMAPEIYKKSVSHFQIHFWDMTIDE
jgi:serine/threonine protein kinase